MSISTLGVSAAFLRDFLTRTDTTHTTQDVCDAIIKPETAGQQCAYVDLLTGRIDAEGWPFVGKATVFVSHAWAYPFSKVCEVIFEDAKEKEKAQQYYWFDPFTNNQHDTTAKPHDWWSTTFKSTIATINSTMLVLYPWTNPVPLARSWCLWEIFCTIDQNVPLHVCVPPSERSEFIKALTNDHRVMMDMLVQVQAENASAKSVHDRETISRAIEASEGGFLALNMKVKDPLRAWLLKAAKDAVKDMEMNETTVSEDYAALCNNVGLILCEQGEYDCAIEHFKKAVATRLRISNESAPDVSSSYFNIGTAYRNKGENDRAIEFFQRSLTTRLITFGEEHPHTAATFNSIGIAYNSKGEYDRAIEYHQRCLAIQLKTLGEEHPDTASSYMGLGNAFCSKGEYDRAIEYHERSLGIKLKALGEMHPDTASSYNNFGTVYRCKGEYHRAIEFYEQCLIVQLRTFGEIHPDTAKTLNDIGETYDMTNERDRALEYFQRSSAIQRALAVGSASSIFVDLLEGLVKQPFGHVKLCFVGQGRAGKTSTLASLNGKPFNPHQPSTVGMVADSVISQESIKAWQPNISDLDAVQSALARHMVSGSTEADSTHSMVDVLLATGQDAASQAHVEGELDANASEELAAALDVATTGESRAATKKKPLWSHLKNKSTPRTSVDAQRSQPDAVLTSSASPPAPLPLVRSTLDDVVSRMDTNFLATKAASADKTIVFDTWDYAGQEVFYNLFHLFLTPNAIYVLLVDMRKLLRCITHGRPTPKPGAATFHDDDALGYLDFWLNSLSHHTRAKDGSCSTIIIAGTYKDVVSDPKDHRRISDFLLDRYAGKPFALSIVVNAASDKDKLLFFPIDNTQSDRDPMISFLREAIEKAADKLDFAKAPVPLSWLRFFDVLQALSRPVPEDTDASAATSPLSQQLRARLDPHNRGIAKLALEDARALAVESGIKKDAPGPLFEDHFLLALSFCYQAGSLLHFNLISVRDVVFLKPQYLVDRITHIIRDFEQHKLPIDKSLRNGRELKRLKEQGILVRALLNDFWAENTPQERDIFLGLMLMFHLALPLPHDGQFLVPALLPKESLPEATSSPRGTLVLAFYDQPADEAQRLTVLQDTLQRDGFMPSGLFPRLVCAALKHSHHTSTGEQAELSAGEVRLQFGAMEFSLVPLPHIHAIRITLLSEYGLPVLQRLDRLLGAVLLPGFETIRYHFLLPYDEDENRFLAYNAVAERLQRLDPVLFVDGGPKGKPPKARITAAELRKLHDVWLPHHTLGKVVHIFISYRQETDMDLAYKLYDCLTNETLGERGERPIVFYDQKSLERGERFDKAFMLAISKTLLCVPIVSLKALRSMRKRLREDAVDNVLLEWSLMLHLESKKVVQRVSPIFVSPDEKTSLFRMFSPATMPDVVSERTHEALVRFLRDELGETEVLPRRTVKDIVCEIFKYNSNLQSWTTSAAKPDTCEDPVALHSGMGKYRKFAKDIIQVVDGLLVVTEKQTEPVEGTAGVSSVKVPLLIRTNPRKPMSTWTTEEVTAFLVEQNFGKYVNAFQDNDINGATFAALTAEHLTELGVSKFHALGLLKLREAFS